MQEVFFTILAIWLVIRLFNAFGSESRSRSSFRQQTHYHFHTSQDRKKEGDVKVETKKQNQSRIPNNEGEYVDYEDIS
ncbi:MAG TPA: DUF4834 family protein [Bacteroidia bacterium]|nr:DUF4834 family protein [Bacteroidia bacterium]